MIKIEVLSKGLATKFQSAKSWAAISIATVAGEWPTLDEENRIALLQFAFKDVDLPDQGGMSKEDAEKIIDFVEQYKSRIETLLIHCDAGLSRSPAIAAAIVKLFGDGDDMYYFRNYTPNMLVYRTMLDVAVKKDYRFAEKVFYKVT